MLLMKLLLPLYVSFLVVSASSPYKVKNFDIGRADTISFATCNNLVKNISWDGIKTVDSDVYELRWNLKKDKSIVQIYISAKFSNVTWFDDY